MNPQSFQIHVRSSSVISPRQSCRSSHFTLKRSHSSQATVERLPIVPARRIHNYNLVINLDRFIAVTQTFKYELLKRAAEILKGVATRRPHHRSEVEGRRRVQFQ